MAKPKFLIVGGGFAGVTLAQSVSKVADVTLVDRKEYFELTWATVRAAIDRKVAEKITIPYKNMANLGKLVVGTVTSLTDKEATLSDGTVLSFDTAAICTGSTYSDKFGKSDLTATPDRLQELSSLGKEIASASSVLVVGGGPSGVEIAAEIIEAHPGKTVTLVHSKDRLLEGWKEGLGTNAKKWLESKGIKVILNDRVERSATPGTVATSKGVSISASTILWATGAKPATSFLRSTLPDVLDSNGLVKVDKTLRVEGHPNLFALGDANNVQEHKKGFLAHKQALLVGKNFAAQLKKPSAKQAEWVPGMGFEFTLVSLGPKNGVGQIGSWSTKGFLPTNIKSKTLFVDAFRKLLQLGKGGQQSVATGVG